MRLAGRNSWTTGFDLIPGVPNLCPALIHPQDFMHDSPEGAVKMEAALVLFMCIRVKEWFSLKDFNSRLKDYPFPPEQGSLPPLINTLLDGRKVDGRTGYPKKGIHVKWNAGQVLHFVAHSCQKRSLGNERVAIEAPTK